MSVGRSTGEGGGTDSVGGVDIYNGESYSLKERFVNEYDPYELKYGTERTISLRMTVAS